MTPFPHRYEARIQGGPTGHGVASARSFGVLRTAPPLEFGGPDDAWTPEHLLLASVEACFLFTFRAIARASRFEFVALDVAVEGTVDRIDRVTRFSEIVLQPRLTVPEGSDVGRATELIEKAERACLVSQSLSTPIRLEPAVLVAAAAPVHAI